MSMASRVYLAHFGSQKTGTVLNIEDPNYRNKKLLGAPGIATRRKDVTRGSWPYY